MDQPPLVFDRDLLLAWRERAARRGFVDFLHAVAGRDLADRVTESGGAFANAVDLSAGTNVVSQALLATGRVGSLTRMEAAPQLLNALPEPKLQGQEEALPFREARFDLIVSALSLQAVNDLPGALVQIRRALNEGGLFLGAMLGSGTLAELRESFLEAELERLGGASPRVAPFTDVRDAGGLLQRAGFTSPVTDIDRITVRYATPFDLFRDLRAMGFGNALIGRSRAPLSRAILRRAVEIYFDRFSDPDGRIRATFVILYLAGSRGARPLASGAAST